MVTAVRISTSALIKMAEQQSLETRLHELEASARNKILKYSSVREGQAKDLEASLEQDFSGLRHVIRELESLAEDQEWVADRRYVNQLACLGCALNDVWCAGRKMRRKLCNAYSSISAACSNFKLT